MNSAADPTPTAIRQPRFIQVDQADHAAARDELIRGLAATEAHTSPKFLYDALGSRLFEAITELPEYYPTRTEAAIFAEHAQHMAQVIGNVGTLVDLDETRLADGDWGGVGGRIQAITFGGFSCWP